MKKTVRHFVKTLLLSGSFLVFGSLSMASTDLEDTIATAGLSGSFLASRIAIGDNDDDAAVRFLERASILDPKNPTIRADLFVSLVANGRIDEAAAMVNDTQKLINSSKLANIVSAVDALRKRSWNKVAGTLDELEGTELDDTLKQLITSWALFGEGKLDEALALAGKIEGPDWIVAIRDHHTGLMAAAGGKDAQAAEKFQKVIENKTIISVLTETYIRSLEALVRLKGKVGEYESAQKTLDIGVSIIPSHRPFSALQTALDEERVLAPLITSAQGGVGELFFNIATAIRRDGGTAFAKNYLQLADHLNPGSDVISIALAELYLSQGDYEKSNTYYDVVDKDSPFFRMSMLERATNLARLEQKPEAIALLKQLIEDDPEDLQGYLTLGELYSRDKRFSEAAGIYDRAVARAGTPRPYQWNLYYRRGIAYERLKQWEKAEPNFRQSIELSANRAEVLNYLGYSWIDQGLNLEEGMDMIRRAVELRPRSGFIVDSLGWAHYRLGEFEDAVRELERAVELMPGDPTVNEHLGDAYWRAGRKLEATFQWKITLGVDPEFEEKNRVENKLREGLGKEADTSPESGN